MRLLWTIGTCTSFKATSMMLRGSQRHLSTVEKPKILILLGGPGSGKGTQASVISSKFDARHISAGDILRSEVQTNILGHSSLIKNCMINGQIVPSEITSSLLKEIILLKTNPLYIVDGFPRNVDNLNGMCGIIDPYVDNIGCVYLECEDTDILVSRLKNRASNSGRFDDNTETIQKRLIQHDRDTAPILNHFRANNKLEVVDASKSIDEVSKNVILSVKKLMGFNSNDENIPKHIKRVIKFDENIHDKRRF